MITLDFEGVDFFFRFMASTANVNDKDHQSANYCCHVESHAPVPPVPQIVRSCRQCLGVKGCLSTQLNSTQLDVELSWVVSLWTPL